ncbi:MAG: tRNA uridine-5-carboxymethylaminomethyl(34) synthesis GTPase MnmE, partial [candidate division NC10 bacterium]|nr:tRNA uridine-5-carboxymethylaminomethyl(34) synthesis GTPase MnmE [candidate division NC10 bacterium]
LKEARGRRGILVVNKADLPQRVEALEMESLWPKEPRARVSALRREGLGALKEAMVKAMERDGLDLTQDLVITRLHHRKALERAQVSLERAKESCAHHLSFEFVSLDLKECLDALGEITGETTSEDLLEEIFSRFCVGK